MFGWLRGRSPRKDETSNNQVLVSRKQIFIACPYTDVPIMGYLKVFERLQANYEEEKASSPKLIIAKDLPSHQGLEQSIIEQIRSAAFGIFDLSGTPPNLNVLYELGIAKGLGIQPFIIRKGMATEGLPADLRGARIHVYSTKKDLENTIQGIIAGEFMPTKRSEQPRGLEPKALGEQLGEAVYNAVKRGYDTTSVIAAQTKLSGGVVRESLSELEESGRIVRTGQTRATRYKLT